MNACKVEGCGKKVHGHGYCRKHHLQLYRYGRLFEHTRYDLPKIEIDGSIARLPLYNNKGEKIVEVLIDADEVEWVGKYKWYRGGKGHILNKHIGSLARAIVKAQPGDIVDHINRNTFDNRKANLRIVDRSANVRNSKIPENNTSGVKGVCYHKVSGKWEAFIRVDNIRKREYFATYDEAVACRKRFEKEMNYNP